MNIGAATSIIEQNHAPDIIVRKGVQVAMATLKLFFSKQFLCILPHTGSGYGYQWCSAS